MRLHVRDRGPGFDPALDGHAFERFTRGDRARSRGGTGLGLAIVDAIAQLARRHAPAAARATGGGADAWIELPGLSRPISSRRVELTPMKINRKHIAVGGPRRSPSAPAASAPPWRPAEAGTPRSR